MKGEPSRCDCRSSLARLRDMIHRLLIFLIRHGGFNALFFGTESRCQGAPASRRICTTLSFAPGKVPS